MIVFALDVSSVATGWAMGTVGGVPMSGEHRFAPKGASDDDIWFAALMWATGMLKQHSPDVVAIETPILASRFDDEDGRPQTNPHTQAQLWGLQSVIRTVVKARTGGAAKMIAPSSARKFFTGRGTYPKGEAKAAVRRRAIQVGWLTIEDSSEGRADALCIWAKACGDVDRAFAASFTELGTSSSKPKVEELF